MWKWLFAPLAMGIVWSVAGCGSANEMPMTGGGPWFVLRESPASVGAGMESFRVLYVGADGLVQISQETGEGIIATLQQGHVDTKSFFEILPSELPSHTALASPQASPTMVVEGRGALIRLAYRRADSKRMDWSGPPDSIPAPVSKLIQRARDLQASARLSVAAPGNYLRASKVPDWVAREWRKTDLLTTVTADQLDRSLLLRHALQHEERLVPVPPGKNPYAAIGKAFVTLRDVKLWVNDDVFQVRSLVFSRRVPQ